MRPQPARYRTQRRGGKGLRDIKTTKRNGRVIGIARVDDDDELLMMTARGKLQRIAVSDISTIGRNTQGVRIMTLDEEDALVAIVRVPREENSEQELASATTPSTPPTASAPATGRSAAQQLVDDQRDASADELDDELELMMAG